MNDKWNLAQIESQVASIWREILGIEDLGIDDDFISHGGTSLLMFLILGHVQEVIGVDLQGVPETEARVLFDAPTVRRMARQIWAMVGSRNDGG